jgi:Spy/CpxP family protein refolding chaperone
VENYTEGFEPSNWHTNCNFFSAVLLFLTLSTGAFVMKCFIRTGTLGIALLLLGHSISSAQQKSPTSPGQTVPPNPATPQTSPAKPAAPQTAPANPATPQTAPVNPATPQTGKTMNPYAFGGITQNPWFANNGVQQNLNLTPAQATQLNKIYNDQWQVYQQQLNGIPSSLNEQMRYQMQQNIQQSFYKNLDQSTGPVFTSPAQRQRYSQLYLQYRNFGAFEDPNVQQKLNLTPAQRQQLGQLDQAWNKHLNDIRILYATDPAAAQQQFSLLQQQNAQNINGILNPQQNEAWRQIMGDPYVFQPHLNFQQVNPAAATNPNGTIK